MKNLAALILWLFSVTSSDAQQGKDVNDLLNAIKPENSKYISKTKPGKKLIKQGKTILPQLAALFADSSITTIKSDCQNRFLTRGEVAIIIADNIEIMPYFQLTGIQNCLLELCPGSPNGIEYYLEAIKRQGAKEFIQRYTDWLNSEERKKSPLYSVSK